MTSHKQLKEGSYYWVQWNQQLGGTWEVCRCESEGRFYVPALNQPFDEASFQSIGPEIIHPNNRIGLESIINAKVTQAYGGSMQFSSDDGITLSFDNGLTLCIGFSGDHGNICLNNKPATEKINPGKPGWYFGDKHESELK